MANVAIIVGSLRKNSISKKIANYVATLFPEGYEPKFVEIGNLPLYNQDYDDENNPPEEYVKFREIMKEMDAVLFVTPEHNRTIPATIKNALDVGSRPYGQSVWDGKPAAIISQSPGAIGGFGANHQLRVPLVFLNMPVLQQPEAYIGNSADLFDDNGVTNEEIGKYLQSFVDAFVELIKKHKK